MTVAPPDVPTVVSVAVPYQDARASDLTLSFDLHRRTPLRTSMVHVGETCVELHLLGASHQVVLTHAGRLLAAETVACGAAPGALPSSACWSEHGWTMRFSSRVRTLAPRAFAASARRLQASLARCPHALIGVFPGNELALTGMRADALAGGEIAWRTWHSYPQTRELVTTWTTATEEAL